MIAIETMAARLAGRDVAAVEAGGQGGNNRLYRVRCTDGTVFALKSYPRSPGDVRDRLGAEFQALGFLEGHGVAEVPKALAREGDWGLYEWIEGRPVTPGPADIDQALAFTACLHDLRAAQDAASLPWASEAAISGAEIVAQVSARLTRLQQVEAEHPELAPLLGETQDRLARLTPGTEVLALPAGERTLSPADFGFHNTLRRADNRLVFLDFEYFGWDDPVKLAAEFDLHPGHDLDDVLAARWQDGIARVYKDVPGFAGRYPLLRPLLALRWALIVLNEFLPERWARRQAAGAADATAAKARQLGKARTLLTKAIPA